MLPINLSNLKYAKGSRGHKRKVSGRGFGAHSTRAFKGNKGQGQRITGKVRAGFEGGQTPIYRHVRKIGFNNYEFANNYNVITMKQIIDYKLTTVNKESLLAKKLLTNPKWKIKIIGSNNITIPSGLKIEVDKVSANLVEALNKAGAQLTIVQPTTASSTPNKKVVKAAKPAPVKKVAPAPIVEQAPVQEQPVVEAQPASEPAVIQEEQPVNEENVNTAPASEEATSNEEANSSSEDSDSSDNNESNQ